MALYAFDGTWNTARLHDDEVSLLRDLPSPEGGGRRYDSLNARSQPEVRGVTEKSSAADIRGALTGEVVNRFHGGFYRIAG